MAGRKNLMCLLFLLSFSVFINFTFFLMAMQPTTIIPSDAKIISTDELWKYGKSVHDAAFENVNNIVQYGGYVKEATSRKVKEMLENNPSINKIYGDIWESSKMVHRSAVDKIKGIYNQFNPNLEDGKSYDESMLKDLSEIKLTIGRPVTSEMSRVDEQTTPANETDTPVIDIANFLIKHKLAHPEGLPPPDFVHPDTGLPLNISKYLNESRVVYNRIDNCGSRVILSVIGILSFQNEYHNYRSQAWTMCSLSEGQQEIVANYLNKQVEPYIFDRHFYFYDFDKFGVEPPTFINIICEPLPRFVYLYFFKRFGDKQKPGPRMGFQGSESEIYQSIDDCIFENQPECSVEGGFQMIPYFCGQDPSCLLPSQWALERAKQRVVEKYAFVGIMEDFESSLTIFERLMPQFFKDSVQVYRSKVIDNLREIEIDSRHNISLNAMQTMSRRLTLEYEFYNFVRTRMERIKKQLRIG